MPTRKWAAESRADAVGDRPRDLDLASGLEHRRVWLIDREADLGLPPAGIRQVQVDRAMDRLAFLSAVPVDIWHGDLQPSDRLCERNGNNEAGSRGDRDGRSQRVTISLVQIAEHPQSDEIRVRMIEDPNRQTPPNHCDARHARHIPRLCIYSRLRDRGAQSLIYQCDGEMDLDEQLIRERGAADVLDFYLCKARGDRTDSEIEKFTIWHVVLLSVIHPESRAAAAPRPRSRAGRRNIRDRSARPAPAYPRSTAL